MRAIVMSEHGGPDVLQIQELPDPVPADGEVLIRVKAFGLNHADTYMRSGVWQFGIPVLGIEAAGTIECDPTGRLPRGPRSSRSSAGWRGLATAATPNWLRFPPAT